MDLLQLLPPEIKSHIFKMLSHPIADLFKEKFDDYTTNVNFYDYRCFKQLENDCNNYDELCLVCTECYCSFIVSSDVEIERDTCMDCLMSDYFGFD